MIERKIIIALITSTEFNQRVEGLWDASLFESSTAKRISTWCFEYFNKYQKAPGRQMEIIFYKKVEAGLPKDLAEEIEQDILPSLSEESEDEEFELEPMVDQAIEYFNKRHLLIHADKIKALIANGKLVEAEKEVLIYKPSDNGKVKLENFIKGVKEIRGKKVKRAPMLMSPFLRKGQTTIIYAGAGVGKSLLAISIAYLLGLKYFDDETQEIGKWQVREATGTLYIDGEIGEKEMEERVQQFEWLGRQHVKHKMKILSTPEFQMESEEVFDLSTRPNQLKIIKWLIDHQPDYGLVVIDSVTTLFALQDENSNSEWNLKVNPFLRDLRALNIACLLLHHSGKDNKRGLRGASSMSAMAHNIFKLSDHPEKDLDNGEAWFILTKDKYRTAGFNFRSFALHYAQNSDQSETHWSVTNF